MVKIFYENRTPLFVQVHPDSAEGFQAKSGHEDEVHTVKINPGPQKIDEDLWEYIKTKDSVQKRIKEGYLRKAAPTKSALRRLTGPVDRGRIGVLCAKSRNVPDDELFETSRATSQAGAVREIEDQLEELKNDMPHVSLG